jgi:hypothetical protein
MSNEEAQHRESQHLKDEARADARTQAILDKPLTLTTLHWFALAGLLVVSICGSWLINRATTDMRLTTVEQRVVKNTESIEGMEVHGFGGHEVRLTRLETRVDAQQVSLSEVKAKLDTLTEILIRVEKKVDQIEQRRSEK